MSFFFIVGGIFALSLVLALVRRFIYPRPLPGIPYDRDAARRIIGDYGIIDGIYKELSEWVYPFTRHRSRQLKSPIYQYFPGPFSKPHIVVYDPRETADIIMRRTREFDRSMDDGIFQTLLPHSTVSKPVTPEWKVQRRIWQDTMHPTFLNGVVAKNIYNTAMDLRRFWKIRSTHSGGRPIDIQKDFFDAALDAIWVATFGQRLGLVNSQIQVLETGKQFEDTNSHVYDTLGYANEFGKSRKSFWPAFDRWWTWRSTKYRNYLKVKDEALDRILADTIARFKGTKNDSDSTEEQGTCTMDLVLRKAIRAAQKAGTPVPDLTKNVEMRDELMLFILSGHETTNVTLQWFVKFMTNNQEAQTKLRDALKAAFPGDSLPGITELLSADIPYLSAAIEEGLRCAGTVGPLLRVTTMDTEIFGYKIPAGIRVSGLAILSWLPEPIAEERRSLSSQAAFEKSGGVDWTRTPAAQDLDKYIPERWLKTNEDGKETFDPNVLIHNAFGAGIRGCFGKRLGTMELRIIVTLIIMSFKFLPVPAELNSFHVNEQLLRAPRQCYVKLEAV
ncbi:cytochrome P450 [Daldinia caldariorum]|uniref:cytochrome P450 n=1 Tax=Daldinia caldariorum TaxID=326644 RepID=UPI002008531C|nr:cytochrome P450 [Daldinia caldariorum]KAI1471124.1 cytochrome P450 [Daldinia caldariorum]